MSTVKLRPVEKADEEAWKGLWEQYNEFYKRTITAEVTAHSFKRFLDDNERMYCAVAEDDGKLIGFVTWFPHVSTSHIGDVVYLNDLFVDPSIRNKGTGGQLIEHVYDHAKNTLKAEQVYWLTQYFNHRAQLLYTKIGTKSDFVHYFKNL